MNHATSEPRAPLWRGIPRPERGVIIILERRDPGYITRCESYLAYRSKGFSIHMGHRIRDYRSDIDRVVER